MSEFKTTTATTTTHSDWPAELIANECIFDEEELKFANLLIQIGQSHLFQDWDPPGINDNSKHQFFIQIRFLDSSYIGGLTNYVQRAQKLLAKSKNGENPFDGWKPEIPSGKSLEPFTPDYKHYEELGIPELGRCGFVLVAGGLGERLGYNGIKLELPAQTVTHACYLETYCQQILAIQSRYGSLSCPLPLAIMVSEDTADKTKALLEKNSFFGLEVSQVTLLCQGKVPALLSNDAKLALLPGTKYTVDSKPHGHGDVHSLLHSTGTASKWLQQGISWVVFMQDTNGLSLLSLPAMIGVSRALSLEVNSLAIRRYAKQAIGGIARLVHQSSGEEMTINVEYNQLDPLLRSDGTGQGDENDPSTGCSPYPGNINQLLFSLAPYVATLQRTAGEMPEFVNPKYADASKTKFKKPTRLECMVTENYPRLLSREAKVGFTMAPAWLVYSPCKNNSADAAASVLAGIPAGSAFTAESDQCNVYGELLRRTGAHVDLGSVETYLGISAVPGPRIVFHPSFVLFPHEILNRFSKPQEVKISAQSTLVAEGQNLKIESLYLDGSLRLHATRPDTELIVKMEASAPVVNEGHIMLALDEYAQQAESPVITEVDRMRGYKLVCKEIVEASTDKLAFTTQAVIFTSRGEGGHGLIDASAYHADEGNNSISSGSILCAPFSVFVRNCI